MASDLLPPECAGKLTFYLSGVNDLLRHGDDQPRIDLIPCKTYNRVITEQALRDVHKHWILPSTTCCQNGCKAACPAPMSLEAKLGGRPFSEVGNAGQA